MDNDKAEDESEDSPELKESYCDDNDVPVAFNMMDSE